MMLEDGEDNIVSMNKSNSKMIIGLHGVSQSGKDTSAKVLIEKFGFKRIAFADKLREMLYALNPIVVIPFDMLVQWDAEGFAAAEGEAGLVGFDSEYNVAFGRLDTLVRTVGWDNAKQVPEVRELMQRQGTEAGRNIFGENFWVAAAMSEIGDSNAVVFTDVRFDNEAEAIRNAGGFIIEVVRPGYEPVNDHASDAGLSGDLIDAIVLNHGSVNDLHETITETISQFGFQKAETRREIFLSN